MPGHRYTFKSEDSRKISAIKWIPDDGAKVIAAVQIFHGMAEHIARYENFARFLTKNGFIVVGNDHRGHGNSLAFDGDTGIFAENNGWQLALNDTRRVTRQLIDQHGNLPIFIISHSMGSFFARDYISRWGGDIAGVILSGTGNPNRFTVSMLKALASIELLVRGLRHRSKLLDNLSFGSFNKPFEPQAPTCFEWLSRDREQVDRYVADPLCGFICTCAHFRDLALGLKRISRKRSYTRVPKKLPIFLYSGDEDPVGGKNGSDVKAVYQKYRAAGIKDVRLELNREGRHESLNESNRQMVYDTFLRWLTAHV